MYTLGLIRSTETADYALAVVMRSSNAIVPAIHKHRNSCTKQRHSYQRNADRAWHAQTFDLLPGFVPFRASHVQLLRTGHVSYSRLLPTVTTSWLHPPPKSNHRLERFPMAGTSRLWHSWNRCKWSGIWRQMRRPNRLFFGRPGML